MPKSLNTKSAVKPKKTTDSKNKSSVKTKKILNKTFYYSLKKLKQLALLNFVLVLFSLKLCYCEAISLIDMPILVTIVTLLSSLAFLGSLFVIIHPLRLALVTEEGLIIDHNQLLKWNEIQKAVEFEARYIYTQHAIALHTKKGVTHQLTFMQKVCKNNVFTPFSIPLYAMDEKAANEIKAIIKQKVKYENTIKE